MYSNKSLITSRLCSIGGVIFGNYNGFQTIFVVPMILITPIKIKYTFLSTNISNKLSKK